MSETKQKVKVSEVLKMLDEGLQRPEIAEILDTPLSVLQKTVFQHPKLKGRKAKKVYDIEVIDDTEEEITNQEEEITNQEEEITNQEEDFEVREVEENVEEVAQSWDN
jgi:hypothetical protein